MRKLFSILFVVLILFNTLGYYGLFLGLEYRNDLDMAKKLDSEGYADSETITIKMPLAMPYGSDSEDFERVDGQFEHNGQFYRMVKQRLSQDTLYIVCVQDQQSKRIDQAFGDYVNTLSDNPTDNNQSTKAFTGFIKDYIAQTFSIRSLTFGWEREVLSEPSLTIFLADFHPSITHPPERG